jgi:hypothetical protein
MGTLKDKSIHDYTAKDFVLYFCEAYRGTFKMGYVPSFAKDGKHFKDLLEAVPPKELRQVLDFAFHKEVRDILKNQHKMSNFMIGSFRCWFNVIQPMWVEFDKKRRSELLSIAAEQSSEQSISSQYYRAMGEKSFELFGEKDFYVLPPSKYSHLVEVFEKESGTLLRWKKRAIKALLSDQEFLDKYLDKCEKKALESL